jgi:hypothetical protein
MSEIKLKISTVLEMEPHLKELSERPLPSKVSYRIAKILSKIKTEMSEFQDARFELIKKYGEPIEDNEGAFQVTKDNLSVFGEEFKVLIEEEVTLIGVSKVNVTELFNIALSPSALMALEPIINDDT